MTAMTPGSNLPLPAPRVAVEVTAPRRLDVSGLLLGADGKVRSDADFVFYNQPEAPGLRHTSGAQDTLTLDTEALPTEVEKVVITASLGDGAAFAGAEPTATLRDTTANAVLATFTPPALGRETALVVVEVYRRGGAWKVRAVGQGYADGLAGIATDFGVDVEESAAPAGGSAPAPQAGPLAAVPAQSTPPEPPAAPTTAAANGVGDGGKVNLDKGKVDLRKRQTVSLVKAGAPVLTSVTMGLGWEPAFHPGKRGRDIDLDASLIAFDADRNPVEQCYFGRLIVFDGVIQHSGDNLTGEGSGDDEAITVHLGAVPTQVQSLVFTVNSFSGQKFTEVAKAYCRLLDAAGTELVRYDLSEAEPRTGVLMAKLVRQPTGEWEMTALGEYVDGRSVRSMAKPAATML